MSVHPKKTWYQSIWVRVPLLITSFMALYQFEEAWGLVGSPWLFFVNFMTAIILVVSYTYGANLFRNKQYQNNFQQFFGLKNGKKLAIVLSAFQDTRKYKEPQNRPENYRYYKIIDEQERRLVGVHDYLTGLRTAVFTAEFTYDLREITETPITIMSDDQALKDMEHVKISFGSDSSNMLTEKIMSEVPNNIWRFKPPDKLISEDAEPKELHASSKQDYAIVLKHWSEINNLTFICAGIDEEGTIAAAYYLIREWENLFRRYGEKHFIHILRCSKRTPKACVKIYGLHLTDHGKYVTD